MTSHFDTSPEVVPSDNLPQVVNHETDQTHWNHQSHNSYASPTSEAPSYNFTHPQGYQQASPPVPVKAEPVPQVNGESTSSNREKRSRRGGCSCLVIALIIALVIAGAAVIGLAAATGVALKRAHDKDSELSALKATALLDATSCSGVPTATSTDSSPSSTATDADETVDITNGCSAKKDTISGTTYTSDFFNNAKFTMYCNTNAPRDPLFSVFAGTFHACIEACSNWNNNNKTKADTCEGVSFVPFWADIDKAAGNDAPGDCYLKPGPQSKGKLDDAPDTHAALLR
ncbi:hypothetical protein NW762_008351 [Fusarium torreyae]|uniref:Apple domain-containing protein n=1 Tax=Fusarium torreyae TaxID=1237075 RepID=A0A9W8RXH9_9HYPO|nr:hypothetical protein NW762_008351 [Fusarium torreyae]